MAEDRLLPDPIADARARIDAGDAAGAVALLKDALRQGRGGVLTRIALGRALLTAGDKDEALEVLREASALAPGIAEAALALGEALVASGHLPTAIAEFQRALRLDPDSAAAHYALACAWAEAGEAQRAWEMLAPLEEHPEFAARIAARKPALEDMLRAPRAPEGYVRHLFDQFSADYDARMLGQLDYRAHLILRSLADLVVTAPPPLRILDLGCGTGLAGEAFADLARGGRLDGVDLSPKMIEAARRRGIYDRLSVADLEMALAGGGTRYDLILAADTFVYLGDLAPVLTAAFGRLEDGGFLLFTVEKAASGDYALGPNRRYRHAESYLRAEAERAGFETGGLLECVPRTEAKVAVSGLAVALRKRG